MLQTYFDWNKSHFNNENWFKEIPNFIMKKGDPFWHDQIKDYKYL